MVKFRFSKKPTKFETISHMFWRLLSKCQINWEIVSNFCGHFRIVGSQKCQIKTSLAWYEASFGKSAGTIASVEAQFGKWSALLFEFTRARRPKRLKALSVCTLWDSYSVCIGDIQVRKFKNYKFQDLKVCFVW